jgi:hypothetical protein
LSLVEGILSGAKFGVMFAMVAAAKPPNFSWLGVIVVVSIGVDDPANLAGLPLQL